MSLPKYSELNDINTLEKIDEEIYILRKTLFDFRMKKSTNQGLKPHLFAHTKRRISQLSFKKNDLLKNQS